LMAEVFDFSDMQKGAERRHNEALDWREASKNVHPAAGYKSMSTGESAFKLCLPIKSYDTFVEKSKLPELFDVNSRINCERSKLVYNDEKLNILETDLVKLNAKTKTKYTKENYSFACLVNAWKILMKNEPKQSHQKKEIENQSTNSADEMTSSTAKRVESKVAWSTNANKLPQVWLKEASACSDLMSARSLCLTKPKKFGDRPDVIYKTILRSFKKYYLSEFNDVTDYKRKKRRISNHSFLIDMANEYVQDRIPESEYEDLGLFITALVQPKLPSGMESNSRLMELSNIVCEVLYRFNKSKMNDLLSYPQFSFILKKFLSIPNLLEFIGEKSSSPEATQNLIAQISFLAERWDEVLTSATRGEFGERTASMFEMPGSKYKRESRSTFSWL